MTLASYLRHLRRNYHVVSIILQFSICSRSPVLCEVVNEQLVQKGILALEVAQGEEKCGKL